MTHGKLAWAAAVIALLLYEFYALGAGDETLSHAMAMLFEAWPFFGVLVGLVVGGLLVHFFWRWTPRGKRMWWWAPILVAGATSCSPMLSSDLREAIEALGKDRASLCARADGGAGGLTIAPGGIPGAGGYGAVVVCRSNEPGSKIEASAAGIKIEHGSSVAAEIVKRVEDLEAALRYLLQKIAEAMEKKNHGIAS